ncbi:hypothetical protein MNBD_UNCLBAC01-657 [hydrothermal vent metagenome]|uniref:Carbohydrate porin n=1 Tax=hydrothermal vent metagenome TaxID=652676 RepID=A0A3B1E1J0_9ZZZZ
MKILSRIGFIILIALSLMKTNNVQADIFNFLEQSRSAFEKKGITFESVYTIDYFANVQGGLQRKDTYLSNLDIMLTVDTEQFGLWENGTFFVYALDNSGGQKLTGSIVGDLQGIDNIEAPRTTRLYEMWYEHTFLDGALSILMGFHDYNSEFDVTEYGGLYLNSSFGISADISASARPSIFPLVAPAIRIKSILSENVNILFAVYDGDAGDPDTSEHFPRSDFDSEGGAFIVSEFDYFFSANVLPGFIKLGAWYNTGNFDDVLDINTSGDALKRDGNVGGYLVIDKMLYQELEDQGLGTFFHFGFNKKNVNEINLYIGGGLNYHGIIPGRNEDDFGIAVAAAIINDDISSLDARDDHETVIEMTYRFQFNEYIRIQPDLQYVINPGAVSSVDNALVIGTRVEMSF